MNIPTTPPDCVISEAELDALERELGFVGMIRYLQQISPGKGDYTAERQRARRLSFDKIREILASMRAENGEASPR